MLAKFVYGEFDKEQKLADEAKAKKEKETREEINKLIRDKMVDKMIQNMID